MKRNSEHSQPESAVWAWRRRLDVAPLLVPWAALVFVALVLFWPSTRSLLQAWESGSSDDTYNHGYLVAAICCWIAWRRIQTLRSEVPKTSLIAGASLVLTGFAWLVALRAGLQTVHQALLPLLLFLAVYAAFGRRIASSTGIAIGYLVFAIPIWSIINGSLQQATVVAAEFLLRATGVTAAVTGNLITLPSGIFEVAGGCSGLHYFIVALALGTLYGEIDRASLRNRILLVLLAVTLAVVANWLRVYVIVVAGYLTDMQHYLVRVDHSQFGWVLFAIMMVPFFVIGRQWSYPANQVRSTQPPLANQPALAMGRGVLLALLAMCLAPLLNIVRPVQPAAPQIHPWPENPGAWQGPSASNASSAWQPVFIGADGVARVDYTQNGRRIEAYAATYTYQLQGKELTGYQNSLPGEQQNVLDSSIVSSDRLVKELLVEMGGDRSLIWFFYEVGSLKTPRALFAQLYYGIASLFGSPLSRIVALRAECASADCQIAREDLEAFLTSTASFGSSASRSVSRKSR